MPTSILLAILNALIFGVSDLIAKVTHKHLVRAATFWFLTGITFVPIVWVYAYYAGGVHLDRLSLPYGTITGCLAFSSGYLFLRSLRTGEASTNAIIFRMSFVVTALLSLLFLHESVTAPKVAGILLIVATVLLLTAPAKGGRRARTSRTRASLAQAAAAMVLYGLTAFFIKGAILQGAHPPSVLAWQTVPYAAVAGAVALLAEGFRINAALFRYALLLGGMQAVAIIFLFRALQWGEASVIVPITQLSFVVTALLASLFLREYFSRVKGFSLALAVVAVVLLSMR